jgi:hypothetical protein
MKNQLFVSFKNPKQALKAKPQKSNLESRKKVFFRQISKLLFAIKFLTTIVYINITTKEAVPL